MPELWEGGMVEGGGIKLNHLFMIYFDKYLQIYKYLHICTDMKLIRSKFIIVKRSRTAIFGL